MAVGKRKHEAQQEFWIPRQVLPRVATRAGRVGLGRYRIRTPDTTAKTGEKRGLDEDPPRNRRDRFWAEEEARLAPQISRTRALDVRGRDRPVISRSPMSGVLRIGHGMGRQRAGDCARSLSNGDAWAAPEDSQEQLVFELVFE